MCMTSWIRLYERTERKICKCKENFCLARNIFLHCRGKTSLTCFIKYVDGSMGLINHKGNFYGVFLFCFNFHDSRIWSYCSVKQNRWACIDIRCIWRLAAFTKINAIKDSQFVIESAMLPCWPCMFCRNISIRSIYAFMSYCIS